MDESLSTEQLAWVLARSAESIRDDIRSGEIDGTRIPRGFRIPKAEALRLARQKVATESGRELSDRDLERLIDEVIETNEAQT
jgi:hypothetical protein